MTDLDRALAALDRAFMGASRSRELETWRRLNGLRFDPGRLAAAEDDLARLQADPAWRAELEAGRAAARPDQKALVEAWIRWSDAARVASPEERDAIAEIHLLQSDAARTMGVSLGALRASVETGRLEKDRRRALEELWDLERRIAEPAARLVRARNRSARIAGCQDFWMQAALRFERHHGDVVAGSLAQLEVGTRGLGAGPRGAAWPSAPWNAWSGVAADDDPADLPGAIARWRDHLIAIDIDFAGAELEIDPVDRPGKSASAFSSVFTPVRHQSGQRLGAELGVGVGATGGRSALRGLLHETGHVLHEASLDSGAACESPALGGGSAARAEGYAVFFEQLAGGLASPARWLKLRLRIASALAERALYTLPDQRLDGSGVLECCRQVEREVLGSASPRPTLLLPVLVDEHHAGSMYAYPVAEALAARLRVRLASEPRSAWGRILAAEEWRAGHGDRRVSLADPRLGEFLRAELGCAPEPPPVEDAPDRGGPAFRSLRLRVVDGDRLLATSLDDALRALTST